MRRLFVLVMALALLFALAAPGAARVTHNESNSGVQLDAGWEGGDAAIWGNDSWGGAQFNYQSSEPCDEGLFVHTQINGYSEELPLELWADPLNGKNKLTSGWGHAIVEGNVSVWDECAADGFDYNGPLGITMDMDGTDGMLGKSSSSNSFHLPGVLNSRDSFRATFREAQAHVIIYIVGGDTVLDIPGVGGQIAAVTWSAHQNGK